MAFQSVPAERFGVADQRSFLHYSVEVGQGDPLQVVSDPDGILGRQIGNGLWTSATELVEVLRSKPPSLLQGQTVLELGAGIGFAGQASTNAACSVLQADSNA